MKNDLLDDNLLGQSGKFNNPIHLIVVALLNVVLTFLIYSGYKTESMRVLTSEGSLLLIQASCWVLLMLLVDIIKAFRKGLEQQELFQWGMNAFLWLMLSVVVIFFVVMLLFIPRVIFIILVFMITNASQVDFERIVLSTPYILFTVIFITALLYYYNRNQQTES